VSAGTIVASIENASENAAVLSAQGAVDAAQAALAKISGGSRDEQKAILQSSVEISQSSYISAQSTAVNALLSSFATVDSSVRGTADPMFSNPDSFSPQFNVLSSDSQLTTNINNARVTLGPILEREAALSKSISTASDLVAELDKEEADLRAVRSFFDQIIRALNSGVPSQNVSASTIATYQASAIAARASVNGALASISGAKENLAAKKQGITVAQKNLEQGVTGGQKEDVAGAQAGLKQAQGSLAAARANLEKTYIRAPISGTINSFSLKRGDYVAMQSPVLTVANNGALEIVAYVTENDAKDIAVGSTVAIENGGSGIVTRVAPALDPVTKKIEVRIGVSGAADLINGQSVIVEINRANARISSKIDKVTVPISAIKIGADQTLVFTVGENNALVAHVVEVGELLGDRVVITDGVTADMKIVTDARGLRDGQTVTTQ
jgi:HlyD family secretion protein